MAGFVIRQKDGPRYLSGYLTLLGVSTMAFCLSIYMTLWLRKENKRRDAMHKDPTLYTMAEKLAETDCGDDATFYRYTV